MRRLLLILKWFLIGWGAFCFALLLFFIVLIACQFGPATRDFATPRDIRFLGGNLAGAQIEKVVHSYKSSRSFTGDHMDAYAVKISPVSVEELIKKDGYDHEQRWFRGDQLPKVLDDAVIMSDAFRGEIPWFPESKELRSSEVYVYPFNIDCDGLRPYLAELLFVRPSDNMVFYIDWKT